MKYGTLVRILEGEDRERICTERFSRLRAMGMDACQLVYKPAVYRPEDADIIRECAERYGVEISAQFCGYYDELFTWDTFYDYYLAGMNSPIFGESRIRYLLSAIPFMERLGVTDMVVHAGFMSNAPFSESYTRMLSCVKLLGGRLKSRGMNLLFETGGESPVAMLRLIRDYGLGNLYVNLDTANLIMYGYGNPVDAMYTYGKYVRNVHAKDGLPPTDPETCGKETELGTGFVDFERVIRQLLDVGYERYLIIERELNGGNGDVEIIKALNYLKTIVVRQKREKKEKSIGG